MSEELKNEILKFLKKCHQLYDVEGVDHLELEQLPETGAYLWEKYKKEQKHQNK
jgi:hypothetical protein